MSYNDLQQFKNAYFEKLDKYFEDFQKESYAQMLEAEKDKNAVVAQFCKTEITDSIKAQKRQKQKAKDFFDFASTLFLNY